MLRTFPKICPKWKVAAWEIVITEVALTHPWMIFALKDNQHRP